MNPGSTAPDGLTGQIEGSHWKLYRRLLVYLKPLRLYFLLSILGNVLYAGASAYMAQALEYVIETVENPTEEGRLFLPALIMALFAVRGVGGFLGGYYIAYVGRHIIHQIRTEVFDRYLRLPSRFFDSNASGHLVSRLTYNVEQVASAATDAVTIIVREGLTVLGLLIVMLHANWKLTLLFLCLGPIIGAILSYVSKRFRKLSQRIMGTVGDVTHVVSEVVHGYKEVRIFGGERYESQRFDSVSENNRIQSLKMEFTKAVSTPVIQLLVAFSIGVLIWLALAPEVKGDMSVGSFLVIITAASMMAKPIRQLTQVNERVQRGVAAAKDLFAVLDAEPEADDGTRLAESVKGDIEFRSVSFRYDANGVDVLKDLNLTISAGQTVALVGRSGGGKSTLANLIPRFYEPCAGEILLDGHPLADYQLSSLRAQIAIVTQHVTLFNDSIANNIAYGALGDRDTRDITQAAERAHALEFIENRDQGLETLIGDNGVNLSGGQRQRLAIARALLKDAPILILDEATSALDNESEQAIQKELDALMANRTTVVIAHRLSTIEHADLIVVMDDGQPVEQGTHEALLAMNGEYARLYRGKLAQNSELGHGNNGS